MPKTHANSDDLRRFARDLQKFTSDLNALKSNIEGKFKNIDWDDQAYRKFEEQFTSTMAVLKRFISEQPQYVQLLNKKADILDQFHQG